MKAVRTLICIIWVTVLQSASALEASDSLAKWLRVSPEERIPVAESIARQLNPTVTIRKVHLRNYINCISLFAQDVKSDTSILEAAKLCPKVSIEHDSIDNESLRRTIVSVKSSLKDIASESSQIRMVNGSKLDFSDVVVGGKSYGDIAQGQSTGHLEWKIAYSYASVKLKANGKIYQIHPEDFVGEKPLGKGHFSYVLSIDQNDNLRIEVKQDD